METADEALRVVLADDHHFFREGMRELLAAQGVAVVGEATDGAEAIALTRELKPDVVVIDLKMPQLSGVEAIREILAASPELPIIVLTASADEHDVLDALTAGASGYLLKDTGADGLASALRLVAGGNAVLLRDALRILTSRVRPEDRVNDKTERDRRSFSERELEIIRLIASGADNAAIGRELSISKHTVKQHVTKIFEKLGVQNRVLVAVYAVRHGLA
jgi:DNA-binding NarL/FixJ family response regulator